MSQTYHHIPKIGLFICFVFSTESHWTFATYLRNHNTRKIFTHFHYGINLAIFKKRIYFIFLIFICSKTLSLYLPVNFRIFLQFQKRALYFPDIPNEKLHYILLIFKLINTSIYSDTATPTEKNAIVCLLNISYFCEFLQRMKYSHIFILANISFA